jgi:hypothetical protein
MTAFDKNGLTPFGESSAACGGVTLIWLSLQREGTIAFVGHLTDVSDAMSHVEIRSRVGADGVLMIALPLGPSEANREVKVVVEPAEASESISTPNREEWKRLVKSMAGCISDPTFGRPEQGEYEPRGEVFP